MQLAQFAGIGALVVGGLVVVLLRSDTTGWARRTMLQMLAGVVIGLLGAFAILIWTTDLVPDNFEWVGLVGAIVIAVALVGVLRLRRLA
jgi:hypothetical protein